MKKKNKISGYILRDTVAALLLSCVTIGLSSAINVTNHTPEASASEHNTAFGVNAHEGAASAEASATQRNSTLTFADRVAYQRAIEEVYWRHRIWPAQRPNPKPSLDAVMSQAQLEKKVADYMRNSQTLEHYWQRPLTAAQLQAEMDRMAQHTKQPEVLRELFEALGNDPFVIAECLARPVLAQRLLAELNERDRVKLTKVAWLKTTSQSRLVRAETQAPRKVAAIDSIAKAVQVNRPYHLPVIASPSGGCIGDTWTATSTTNAPTARIQHTAVWTGSEMIVWGGFHDFPVTWLNSGGRYDPITDTWTATSTANAPSARRSHTAVWTGTEMIVWGGDNFSGYLDTGGRYNPSTDSWTATSTTNAPEERVDHTAVWTGNEMIVWGGFNPASGETNTGGRYDPSMDSWTPTSTTNAPSGRNLHTAVWTGSEMIVWGGLADNSGGRYNPVTDNWVSTSTTNAPTARIQHTAVWTGSEMIVWGGFSPSGGTYFNTGGKYSPATDSWTPTSTTNAPSARTHHTAVWTGSEMTIWGGGSVSGGRYDPTTDGWAPTSTINAPSARTYHTAVWTGSEMIVWGGVGNGFPFPYFNTGGRYCAQAGPTPTPTPTQSRPRAAVIDFNGDGHPDWVVRNAGTRQTGIWYLNNNVFISGAYGPTLAVGWGLRSVADFNRDTHPDYTLFNPVTDRTAIWYLSGPTFIGGAYGPTLPSGWELVASADFNGDNKPDYVLYRASTRQTAIWYLNNNVLLGGAYGPTLPAGWELVAAADFNGGGEPDYLLYKPTTRQTAIWYLNNNVLLGGAYGPTLPAGWELVAAADFNGGGKPDYVLYKANTRQTAIWYMNNNVFVSGAYGPTIPAGWSLAAP